MHFHVLSGHPRTTEKRAKAAAAAAFNIIYCHVADTRGHVSTFHFRLSPAINSLCNTQWCAKFIWQLTPTGQPTPSATHSTHWLRASDDRNALVRNIIIFMPAITTHPVLLLLVNKRASHSCYISGHWEPRRGHPSNHHPSIHLLALPDGDEIPGILPSP